MNHKQPPIDSGQDDEKPSDKEDEKKPNENSFTATDWARLAIAVVTMDPTSLFL